MKVSEKQVKKFWPLPLNTIDLQKLVSNKLWISSDKCMKIAEKLY